MNSELLGVKTPKFYSPEVCQEIVEKCHQYGFLNINPQLARIDGTIAQFHSHPKGKKHYFNLSSQVIKVRQWIFAKSMDLVEKIGEIFGKFYPCKLAFDEEYQQYYFLEMIQNQQKEGNIHVDHVDYESSDWSIANLANQFSSVLYLQVPKYWGSLEIYNRSWRSENVEFEFSKNPKVRTGVNENLVKGHEKIIFSPQVGGLFLFNTNYYHRVLKSPSKQSRITSLSFLGCKVDSKTIDFFM